MTQRATHQRIEETPLEFFNFRDEVLELLQRTPKELSPKFFYDKRGLDLFNQICTLPCYYLSTVSLKLMETFAKEIVEAMKSPHLLFEYGGGNSRKIRILLSHLPKLQTYVPIDICREHLLESAEQLAIDFPHIKTIPACIDYMKIGEITGLWSENGGKRICFFPGSTIGNLLPEEALSLMQSTQKIIAPNGGMLVGVDLKKEVRILEKAYNDPEGVTAEFNLNLLVRLNRELNAQFDLSSFRHLAFYNQKLGRIEMHLESLRNQVVKIDGHPISFQKGETIHTENSYKYSIEEFRAMAQKAGFQSDKVWTDSDHLYSIHYLSPKT